VLLLGALGVVLFNGLNDAALFYYDVDEALEQRDELADQRFRMQGNVIDGSIRTTDEGVEFRLTFDDAEVLVRHQGDPPELFSPDIPVIIEGRFDGEVFRSDEILIRHDSTYEEEHEDRLDRANDDAERRVRSAG
jgi:cytochrome c-type biogenesis protein CcmE